MVYDGIGSRRGWQLEHFFWEVRGTNRIRRALDPASGSDEKIPLFRFVLFQKRGDLSGGCLFNCWDGTAKNISHSHWCR